VQVRNPRAALGIEDLAACKVTNVEQNFLLKPVLIGYFGSFARGDHREDFDVDIVVTFSS
jgi:predicted nucleotidyltransferase